MARLVRCSQMQLLTHVILLYAVGFVIGMSILSVCETGETQIIDKLVRMRDDFDNLSPDLERTLNYFEEAAIRIRLNSNSRIFSKCNTISQSTLAKSNYRLRHSFPEYDFKNTPNLIYSINGIDYHPIPVPAKGTVEQLSFTVEKIDQKEVVFNVRSSFGVLNSRSLDNVQYCLLIFGQNEDYHINQTDSLK